MIIVSDNYYFRLGLSELLNDLNLITEEIHFIDMGSGVFIINSDDFRLFIHKDALSAVISIRNYFYNKNEIIRTIRKFSRWKFAHSKHKLLYMKSSNKGNMLTNKEYSVLKASFDGMSTYEISKELSINLKTVSSTKIRALIKLNYKNINYLISDVVVWDTVMVKYKLSNCF